MIQTQVKMETRVKKLYVKGKLRIAVMGNAVNAVKTWIVTTKMIALSTIVTQENALINQWQT